MIGTASGLEALKHCPASAVFPHSRSTGPDAEDGHEVHAFAHDLVGGLHPVEALTKRPKALHKRLANLRRADLVGDLSDDVRSEVAYALNIVTDEVRELGISIDRDYPPLDDDWIAGTLDVEGLRLDGLWAVKDLKSGHGDPVTPAAVNLQLLFFGRVLFLLHDRDVAAEIVRMRPDGTMFTESSATYRSFALDSFGAELLEIREGVLEARKAYLAGGVTTSEGSWCRYCAAFAACPAKQSLVRRMLPELEELGAMVKTLTPEQAGHAWTKLRRIGVLYDAIEKSIKERAKREPLPTIPGKCLRLVKYPKEHFDQSSAISLLRDLGATEEVIQRLYVSKDVEQVRETNRGSR